MAGLSEPTDEPFIPICGCIIIRTLPTYPAEIDVTTRSDTRSIEFAYLGTFENAFVISGNGLSGQNGWLATGLYLTGDKGIGTVTQEGDVSVPVYQREIINTGTIKGVDYSIVSESLIETVIRNDGALVGDVALDGGADYLINTGRISGGVFSGNEGPFALSTYDRIENHGIITGLVDLGAGDDTFTAFGNARVGSKAKAAAVRGMDGRDTLIGANRDDRFSGGNGDDTLLGRKGDDRLFGNAGDDILRGGAGADVIAGGLGQDRLFGGAGGDVFQFHNIDASGRGVLADRIMDFQQGRDRIDLSAIADDIDFVGSEAFSASGRAEVRCVVGSTGTAQVFVDADGDGVSDMRLNLRNTPELLETDFIL